MKLEICVTWEALRKSVDEEAINSGVNDQFKWLGSDMEKIYGILRNL
jgi:hypothetical protein